jgi:ribosomal-protein-alanine N-acetyltransferase
LNQGCQEVFLEVRVSNFPAQNLYRSLDFTAIGIRTKYYSDGEDAIIMKKIISKEG